ncbi:hypothetical protein HYU40_04790 [Candidatus Woesearchaeota archaeon]|nr:hypothetical protein [Candidatus Woesearchaeota archaeon]
MEAQGGQEKNFSRCEICRAELGSLNLDTPLYCVPCIEEMEKLSMSPKRYRRHRELSEALSGK